jgi:hypothetical protein
MAQRTRGIDSPFGIHKVKFTQTEDIKLLELVAAHGERDWPSIARQMQNRTVRQCRERWCNYLAPWVANGPWSADQNALLLEKFKEFGPKWKTLTRFFPGRTDINIKNHYMTITGRRCSASKRAASQEFVPAPLAQPAVQPEITPAPKPPTPVCDLPVETRADRPSLEWGWLSDNASDDIPARQRNMERDFYFMCECL